MTKATRSSQASGKLRWRRTGAKISVADAGPGIVLPHLFKAYAHRAAATTQRQDCVGLGLAIIKALIELHAGQIRVVTQPGHGATMILELPRRRNEMEAVAQGPRRLSHRRFPYSLTPCCRNLCHRLSACH